MENVKLWSLISSLSVIFIMGLVSEAACFDFLDGKLKLHGFIRNETGLRLKEDAWYDIYTGAKNAETKEGQLSTCRSTLFLDGEYNISQNLRFGFIFRTYYDAKWDLNSSIDHVTEDNENELRASPEGEYLESDYDLREWHFLWNIGNLFIKAGQQQIVWGEADAIRISDIINPLDYSKDYTTTAYGLDWEDVRIPQRMVDIKYVVPESPQQFEIEVALNPEDTRVNTYSPYGELYYGKPGNSSLVPTDEMLMALGLPTVLFSQSPTQRSFYGAFGAAIDDALPEENSNRFAGGMRLRGVFGGWDTHLFYYYQRVQNPVFTSSGNFPYVEAGPVRGNLAFPWDVFDENLGIKAHFPHINTIGGTFNYFHDASGTVFRGELGYAIDYPYTGLRQGEDPTIQVLDPNNPFGPTLNAAWGGWFNSDVVEKDTLTYMLGFDRPTWISWLNRTKTFFITGQFIHKIILNYDDEVAGKDNKLLLDTVMGKDGTADHQTMVSLKVNTGYYDDRIKPDLLVVWDINGHDGYVKPALGWEPTYDWRIELGGLYFWADNETSGPFGPVSDDDQIYAMIERRF